MIDVNLLCAYFVHSFASLVVKFKKINHEGRKVPHKGHKRKGTVFGID